MPTAREALDATGTMFKDAWDASGLTTGKLIQWDNVQAVNPPGQDADGQPEIYAKFFMRHATGDQRSLAAPDGRRKFTHVGTMTIQTFTPSGMGTGAPLDVAQVVKHAFEGKKSLNNVWFRDVRYNERGTEGNHYQIDVLATFEYDEIR